MMTAYALVYANVAGAARGESPAPAAFGTFVGNHWFLESLHVVSVALSEVMRAGLAMNAGGIAATSPKCLTPGPVLRSGGERDDLEDFQTAYGTSPSAVDLATLSSRRHNSPEAMKLKWERVCRIQSALQADQEVRQGQSVLFPKCPATHVTGMLIRSSGPDPLTRTDEDPLSYAGNRDTEPRSAVFYTLEDLGAAPLRVVATQLETHSDDVRVGRNKNGSPVSVRDPGRDGLGRAHRFRQIVRILDQLDSNSFALLLGDLNTTPGAVELLPLADKGFELVEFGGVVGMAPREITPDEHGAYSHVEHKLRIDLAFLRRLPAGWTARQYLLELPDEADRCRRPTDHRVLVVTLCPP